MCCTARHWILRAWHCTCLAVHHVASQFNNWIATVKRVPFVQSPASVFLRTIKRFLRRMMFAYRDFRLIKYGLNLFSDLSKVCLPFSWRGSKRLHKGRNDVRIMDCNCLSVCHWNPGLLKLLKWWFNWCLNNACLHTRSLYSLYFYIHLCIYFTILYMCVLEMLISVLLLNRLSVVDNRFITDNHFFWPSQKYIIILSKLLYVLPIVT